MNKKEFLKDLSFYVYETILFLIFLYFVYSIKLAVQASANNLPVPVTSLPSQLLYWIPLCLLVIPLALPKISNKKKIFSLILLCFAVFLSYPLFSLYGQPYGRDSSYTYQLSELIINQNNWYPNIGTGFAITYSHYPLLYFYNLIFAKILFFMPLQTSFLWSLSILRLILIPILIFLILRKMFSIPLSLIGVFLYISCPSLINWQHHEGFAIIFLLATLVSILYLEKNKLLRNFLIILFSTLTILSHHFTSYILISWLTFLFLFGKFRNWKERKNKLKDKNKKGRGIIEGRILLIIIILFFSWGVYSSLSDLVNQSESTGKILLNIITPRYESNTPRIISGINLSDLNQSNLSIQDIISGSESSTENISTLQKISDTVISIPKNIISPTTNRMSSDVGTSFKLWEKMIIFLSMLIIFLFLIWGFLIAIKSKNLPVFYWANFWFCIIISFLSALLIFTNNYFILQRIFEFSYIGFIPLILLPIKKLYNYKKIFFSLLLIILFSMIFIGGNLIQDGPNQRYFYKPDKIKETSESQFISPSIYSASSWAKNNIEESSGFIGDAFIRDSIGTFGVKTIFYYRYNSIYDLFVYNRPLSQSIFAAIQFQNINYIAKTKYANKFRSFKKYYTFNLIDKNDKLDKIYNNYILQIYNIKIIQN